MTTETMLFTSGDSMLNNGTSQGQRMADFLMNIAERERDLGLCMGLFDEIKSRNCALYGQWFGIISIILLIALGIVGFISHIVFSIVGWVIAFILIFVEVPLCLRMCPTSPKFDSFIAYFENCYFRAIMYLVFAVVMFLSTLMNTGPLVACGVTLLLGAICYGVAAFSGQAFASSKFLGGTGVDNVV
ncbi:hypothetical protein BDF20DRAFT_840014 [Mycotypha africana]|uniref:uncharacterized protein n=1 Tax=Mycotypha africana TaxID=64632 RepID=UPI00230088ED|nr:uncharacterized protein BDF20DRAFT_840014 [Mycotypha africana]KAI8967805.1 hypothetical protein BDF20DRAFT_840014 [Mycotypha africana]